jgi:hypothetical protein
MGYHGVAASSRNRSGECHWAQRGVEHPPRLSAVSHYRINPEAKSFAGGKQAQAGLALALGDQPVLY